MRCVKTGRKCDGYLSAKRGQSSRLGLSLSPSPEFESAAEVRAFDYYRNRSAPTLGSLVDADFWSGSVLRFCLTEPAVRHAVLALSSLHEYINSKGEMGHEIGRNFAFHEYGKAMVEMRQWNPRGEEPAAIPLLVCVLFTCIEFLLDHETSSQLHICQGRQILSGLEDSQGPSMNMIRQELVPIYARLSLASYLYARRPAPIPDHLRQQVSPPAEFKTFSEARNNLYHMLDEGLRFTVEAKPAIYSPESTMEYLHELKATQQRHLSNLNQWHTAFTILSITMPPDPAWGTQQKLLRVYYHAATIWISTCLQADEVAYDDHLPAFAAIISLAASILDSQASQPQPRAFTFETELIAPVYWTATKCRHPMLRRSAIQLLLREEMRERKENLWYGREVIAIALRVVELEEGGNELSPSRAYVATYEGQATNWREKVRHYEMYPGELSIPLTHPPSIYAPQLDFAELPLDNMVDTFYDLNSSSQRRDGSSTPPVAESMPQPLPAFDMDSAVMVSPFNVPESCRVKNATVGPREGSGVWTNLFMEPEPGKMDWAIKREVLKL